MPFRYRVLRGFCREGKRYTRRNQDQVTRLRRAVRDELVEAGTVEEWYEPPQREAAPTSTTEVSEEE